jgi:3-deoxy-D-manno-octulosonic-acid transferase
MKLAIYNFFILIFIPIFVLRIIFKSKADSGYKKFFLNRFGYSLERFPSSEKKIIWFHAVSLGEVIGSEALIKKLLQNFDIVLTTSTPTGLRKAKDIHSKNIVIHYAPWDLIFIINRFINFYKPRAILVFETELWPTMISMANKKNIPLYLMNGRLSEKSYRRYALWSWLFSEVLQRISFLFVQTNAHRERFLKLGIKKDRIKIAGSVKFDVVRKDIQPINVGKFILAASTHPGEEEKLLKAYENFSAKKDFKLFICPRHEERAEVISQKAISMGFKAILFSELRDDPYEVCIINSTGFLSDFYASASMAFVGGSLVARGGHNLIEPAVLGTPIIIGPHTFNFEDIVQEFHNNQACIRVSNQTQLLDAIEFFASDREVADKYAHRAKEVVEKNKGSTEVQASYIISQLGEEH